MLGRHHHKRSALRGGSSGHEIIYSPEIQCPRCSCHLNSVVTVFSQFPVFFLKNKNWILQRGNMVLIINNFIEHFPAFCLSSMHRVAFPSTLVFGWSHVVSFGQRIVYGSGIDHLQARIFSS